MAEGGAIAVRLLKGRNICIASTLNQEQPKCDPTDFNCHCAER